MPTKSKRNEQILITGGTGFVGPHLIRYLKPFAASITVIASGVSFDSEPEVEYHSIDIRDESRVRKVVQQVCPTRIYHLASISAVDLSWAKPRLTFEVNVLGTLNIFEAAMSLRSPPKILNVSTSQVYALCDATLTENSLVDPDNPYAASKAMAELLTLPYRRASVGGIVTGRSFNHSGPGQAPSFFLSSIAKQFAEIESGSRPPTLKVGNLNVKRDFTDVRDVVAAYDMLLDNGRVGETYNVCSGVSVCLADIVEMFKAITGVKVAIETEPNRIRSNEMADVCGDPRKLRDRTGWYPKIPLEKTIEDLFNYWQFKCRESTAQAGQ